MIRIRVDVAGLVLRCGFWHDDLDCYFFRAFREKVWDAGQGIEVARR